GEEIRGYWGTTYDKFRGKWAPMGARGIEGCVAIRRNVRSSQMTPAEFPLHEDHRDSYGFTMD
ncbi:MAG: hypothetical protein ACRD2L_23125, partial [Terriglobia bacterium]